MTSLAGYLPSPTVGVLHLGPLPLRGYALSILAGIVAAIWISGRRLELRGHPRTVALDISGWAVIFGILGGRIYHLITTPQPYFGEGGHPLDAFKIWTGGLGIWGAIALGAVGAWIGARRAGIPFLHFADAAAPGIALAQGLGRWGNWFNNELYGAPTTQPWGLTIHQWDQAAGRAVVDAAGQPVVLGHFQPTFLYEAIFVSVLALFLVLRDRWRDRVPGEILALYVMLYPVGRIVVEKMRTDEANLILGQRVNVWTSILVFLLGLALLVKFRRDAARRAPDQDDPASVPASESTPLA